MRLNANVCLTILSVVLIALIFPALSPAQQVTAAITGRVTDASGATVPGANVVATDKDRGTEWPTTTNADGVYNLPRLPIGSYSLKVEHAGFQVSQVQSIVLDMNQVARIDVALQVGNVTQTVEVPSSAPLLQTQ